MTNMTFIDETGGIHFGPITCSGNDGIAIFPNSSLPFFIQPSGNEPVALASVGPTGNCTTTGQPNVYLNRGMSSVHFPTLPSFQTLHPFVVDDCPAFPSLCAYTSADCVVNPTYSCVDKPYTTFCSSKTTQQCSASVFRQFHPNMCLLLSSPLSPPQSPTALFHPFAMAPPMSVHRWLHNQPAKPPRHALGGLFVERFLARCPLPRRPVVPSATGRSPNLAIPEVQPLPFLALFPPFFFPPQFFLFFSFFLVCVPWIRLLDDHRFTDLLVQERVRLDFHFRVPSKH